MDFYRGDDGILHDERRATVRARVDCVAQLRMTSGDRSGQLVDISEGGARLYIDNPPRAGTSGLLQWKSFESFCSIAWAREDACGLAFEKPIPYSVVLDTIGRNEEANKPAADHSKIPLGNRRSRR
ncbi:MAG: PilZ domain-containing protein [Novosphingobium sp.]|nr:PilZ domain-containing protein [Novosphingobium sp.]